MEIHEKILSELPQKFERRDWMQQCAETTAYSYSHSQNLLHNALHAGAITRKKRGVYVKCEPEFELS